MRMMKGIVFVIWASFGFVFLGQLAHAEIYKWIDEKGTTHFTEDPAKVPEKYREETKTKRTEEDQISPEKKPGTKQIDQKPAKEGGANKTIEGSKKAPENRSGETQGQNQKAIKQAKELLDSWRGQQQVLIEAKQILDKVLAEDPENYRALKELSRFYVMDGYLSDASRMIGSHGYFISQFKPGALSNAERILKKALQINPNYAEGYVLLGHIYTGQSRMKEAAEALTMAETLGTDDPWLHLNWSRVFDITGETEKMADRCRVVTNSGTKEKKALIGAYTCLRNFYEERGEYKQVDDLYKQVCALDPNNAWVRGNYADFLRTRLGKFDEALKYAREALDIMNYGVGKRILSRCLYEKWADLIINQKIPEKQAKAYYEEAFNLDSNLNMVMAYEGAHATSKALVQLLQSKGTSIDARAEDGSTALIIASNTGRLDAVKMLLSLGANPNAKSNNGWTPLLGSADSGHGEVVEILLRSGADTSQTIRNKDAAALAEMRGKPEIATLIRQYCKTLNNTGPKK